MRRCIGLVSLALHLLAGCAQPRAEIDELTGMQSPYATVDLRLLRPPKQADLQALLPTGATFEIDFDGVVIFGRSEGGAIQARASDPSGRRSDLAIVIDETAHGFGSAEGEMEGGPYGPPLALLLRLDLIVEHLRRHAEWHSVGENLHSSASAPGLGAAFRGVVAGARRFEGEVRLRPGKRE